MEKIKKLNILKNEKFLNILLIIIIASVLCIPLLSSSTNVYYDDGIQHIARAYGTYMSFMQNGIFTRVISQFANNFGYSWDFFYGSLTTYGICFFALFFKNFIVSYKIYAWICMILSGIFMYKFVKEFSENEKAGVLAGVLYMTFPYHLTDLYIRNAIPEYTTFLFIPLVFLGLYKLIFTDKNHYEFIIGAVGIVLNHNLSIVMVGTFGIIFLLFYLDKLFLNKEKLKGFLIDIVFILLITSFFWFPMMSTLFGTRYYVSEDGVMSSAEDIQKTGLSIRQLFVTYNDNSYVFDLGIHFIVMLAFSLPAFQKMDKKFKTNYIIFLALGIISVWMSTKYFPWKLLPDALCIVQFAWRNLMIADFFLSIICSMNMYILIKDFKFTDVIVISIISVLYVAALSGYVRTVDGSLSDISNVDIGNISGKEREYVPGVAYGEYLPTSAYENRFYIATREDYIEILSGNAVITDEEKDGSCYTAHIDPEETDNPEDYVVFELPYIYYPGYEVRVDGMIYPTFESNNGFLAFVMMANDEGDLSVKYVGTTGMKISMIISAVSVIGLGVYVIIKKKKTCKITKNVI